MERSCFDCARSAPRTPGDHTLISSKHGWRLAREKTDGGEVVPRWRCPTCWRAFRDGQRASESGEHAAAETQGPNEASTVFQRITAALRGGKR